MKQTFEEKLNFTIFEDALSQAIIAGEMTLDEAVQQIKPVSVSKSDIVNATKKFNYSVLLREDKLDNRLFAVMQALKDYGEKWTVTPDNNIVTSYPHPVVTHDGVLVDIVFKPTKYNIETMLPPVLAERHNKLYKNISKRK